MRRLTNCACLDASCTADDLDSTWMSFRSWPDEANLEKRVPASVPWQCMAASTKKSLFNRSRQTMQLQPGLEVAPCVGK